MRKNDLQLTELPKQELLRADKPEPKLACANTLKRGAQSHVVPHTEAGSYFSRIQDVECTSDLCIRRC